MKKTLWIFLICISITLPLSAGGQKESDNISPFVEIAPDIFMFTDSVNSYVLRSGKSAILIETGRGEVKEHLYKLGIKKIDWILHTHPHRDLSQGDDLFLEEGTRIAVPEGTAGYYRNAEELWHNRPSYFPVEYKEGYFLPLRNIPVHRELKSGEEFQWKGFTLKVKRTLGHSDMHVSYILEHEGRKLGFTGDIIHSPGRVWELESLQETYESFGLGISNGKTRVSRLLKSLQILRMQKLDLILPAHGEPFGDCNNAISLLEKNLMEMISTATDASFFGDAEEVDIPEISVYQTVASQYLIEKDGYAFLYDAGFNDYTTPTGEKKDFIAYLKNREADGSLKGIDYISPSHFHCDHNSLTNGLAAHFNSQVILHESMKEVTEEPHRFFLPCLYMYSIPVDRTMTEGESIEWRGYTMTFYHFPGQTWWHQAMLLDTGEYTVLFVGDSLDDFDHIRALDPWNYTPVSDTEGAIQCIRILEETRPDYIATGHSGLKPWNPVYTETMLQNTLRRNRALEALIGQEEVNFGNDMQWVRMDSFRNVAGRGETLELKVVVRNHHAFEAPAEISLVTKEGWTVEPMNSEGAIPGKSEGEFLFRVTVPQDAPESRHMIGIDASLNGRAYGEIGMGIIDVGRDHEVLLRNPSLIPGVSRKDYGTF
ncbi:MAG: MBL fold metallo-hydrolase [Spirochaetales bacterium]|nr:MBL fold metallo-hydrolase [Spirochaetales bacterium]